MDTQVLETWRNSIRQSGCSRKVLYKADSMEKTHWNEPANSVLAVLDLPRWVALITVDLAAARMADKLL